jgi:hypothetical protein
VLISAIHPFDPNILVLFVLIFRRFTEEVQGLSLGEKHTGVSQSEGGGVGFAASDSPSAAEHEAEGMMVGLENQELASGSGSRAAEVYRDLKSRCERVLLSARYFTYS